MSVVPIQPTEHPAVSRHRLRQRLTLLIDRLIVMLDDIDDDADLRRATAQMLTLAGYEVQAFDGAEEALVRWCALNQLRARPLRLVGYDEDEE